MSHSNCTKLNKLLKQLKDYDFEFVYKGKSIVKIIPPSYMNANFYCMHMGEKGYHPIRRYLQKECGINIE